VRTYGSMLSARGCSRQPRRGSSGCIQPRQCLLRPSWHIDLLMHAEMLPSCAAAPSAVILVLGAGPRHIKQGRERIDRKPTDFA
jgi:hypothetical protein